MKVNRTKKQTKNSEQNRNVALIPLDITFSLFIIFICRCVSKGLNNILVGSTYKLTCWANSKVPLPWKHRTRVKSRKEDAA